MSKINRVILDDILANLPTADVDVAAADITDSTSVGRAVLTASDAAAGRSALGAASDATVVHLSGAETITGPKVFTGAASLRAGVQFSANSSTSAVTLTLGTSSRHQRCSAASAAFTVTLPNTTDYGHEFIVLKVDTSANAVTVSSSAGVGLSGQSVVLREENEWVAVASTPTSGRWAIIGRGKASGVVPGLSAATGSRPSASVAGAGAMMFDSTLGKPIWSTGSAWVDATGATV
ncbi:hypothetical protein SEA_OREGANO_29 [Gordonia phage Oregano]|nr:hypothetical protein SEA_OREGANO_29 [Gordonia phage Oregano]